MAGVNLIVSCTKRKTRVAQPSLRLRDLAVEGTVEGRARGWVRRLRAERSGLVAARELYCGDHWAVVRSIAGRTTPGGETVRVWVCSAGYGLVTPDSLLAPYDATFTPGQADSVALPELLAPKEAVRTWWEALGSWEGPAGAPYRSIAAVAAAHPGDFLLLALSTDYLAAVTADLRAAAALAGPDGLAVISGGAGTLHGLDEHLLPCDARLQPAVGGALASLNVRVASRLLQSSRKELSLARCRALLRRWMSSQQPRAAPARAAVSDEEVTAFIRASLAREPGLRATPLLRRLRDQGTACEHGRFVKLFREVRGLTHAG